MFVWSIEWIVARNVCVSFLNGLVHLKFIAWFVAFFFSMHHRNRFEVENHGRAILDFPRRFRGKGRFEVQTDGGWWAGGPAENRTEIARPDSPLLTRWYRARKRAGERTISPTVCCPFLQRPREIKSEICWLRAPSTHSIQSAPNILQVLSSFNLFCARCAPFIARTEIERGFGSLQMFALVLYN